MEQILRNLKSYKTCQYEYVNWVKKSKFISLKVEPKKYLIFHWSLTETFRTVEMTYQKYFRFTVDYKKTFSSQSILNTMTTRTVLKKIKTETVFTKTEMNNEWSVDFLENTRPVEKVSRQKLYLPRQKWTMNKTLIFFKIRGVLKKYPDESCIYQDRHEQWMKRWFFLKKYELCWKSIPTEAVFTKTEMNNEWNVDFLENTRPVEKVSRQKLYLPRQKWTMNKTLIFFKIRGVLKKYPDESCIYQDRHEQWMKRWFLKKKKRAVLKKYPDGSCIYQDRNEQWMKRWFSWKYEACWKSILTEAVFTKTKMNNE